MESSGMEGHGQCDRGLRDSFRTSLQERVGKARFATFFGGDVAIAIGRNAETESPQAEVLSPSAFEQGLLRDQFRGDLEATASEILGEGAQVVFEVKPVASPASPPRAKKASPKPAAPAGPVAQRRPKPQQAFETADDWVVGTPNAEATQLCANLAAGRPGPAPALIWGPSGVGKTQLLQKLADALRRRKRRVLAIAADDFLRGFVEAARGGGFPSFRQKHEHLDALLIDDLQHLLGKRKTLEEFRQTIDTLIDRGAQVVFSADRGPLELRDLGPELASRLAGGIAVEAQMPNASMRKRLATNAARRLGVGLPEAAAAALANRLVGGGREISGAVNRLLLLHQTFGSPLDEKLAVQVADDTNRLSTPPVRLADIQRAVCGVFDVDAKTLKSDKRSKAVTEPRMLAMFLARKMTGSAWSEIGDFFGRRSHSTVIAAHRRVEKLLASQEPTRLIVGDLGETIRRVEAALRSA